MIQTHDQLSSILYEALAEYNETFAVMDLVLFNDAMAHICRISRIAASGHAMLVGVGGSGKQSLSRLTAFILGSTISTITISRTYSTSDLKADLMAMYIRAGQKDEQLSFIFTDSQVTDEYFLVYLNDLLATGDIPDLFHGDEKEAVINALRNQVKAAGIPDTNENIWSFFLQKVRVNLHLILCFSPVGESFRRRCRRFPALVNSTGIDWFHAWPADALLSVAHRFLGDVELGTAETKEAIVSFMPFSFNAVQEQSREYLRTERRHNYTTPKSFLELVDLYKTMLAARREQLGQSSDRLRQGLDKLMTTAAQVLGLT